MSEFPPSLHPDQKGNSGAKIATGCGIGCLVSVVVAGILIFFGVKSFQSKIDSLASRASSEPIEFNYPAIQVAEAESVIQRFDNFREALAKSRPTGPLILSEDDLNILIAHHRDLALLAGKSKITIVDNQIASDFSVKPEDLPFQIPFLSQALAGKYVNGNAKVDLRVRDGKAEMYLLDFKFAGMTLPGELLAGLKGENLLKDSAKDKDLSEFVEKIEELKVEDNKLHVIPRKIAEPPPGQ